MCQTDGIDKKYVQGQVDCLVDVLSGILKEISKSPFKIRPDHVLSALEQYRSLVPTEQYSPYEDGYLRAKFKLEDSLRKKRSSETS